MKPWPLWVSRAQKPSLFVYPGLKYHSQDFGRIMAKGGIEQTPAFLVQSLSTLGKNLWTTNITQKRLWTFTFSLLKLLFIGWPFSRVIQEFHCSYFHELKLKMRTNQISLSVIKQYTLQKSGWFCRGGSVTRMQRRLSDTYAEEA